MKDQNCYFFVDPTVPEEERTISVMCVKCHDEEMPETGWFYRGSEEGYGPFDYQCELCGKFVHKVSDDEDDKEKAEATS